MIYIIDARLKAQAVEKERSNKVYFYFIETSKNCIYVSKENHINL